MLSVGEVAGQPAVLQGDARVDEGRGSTVVVHKERLEDGERKDRYCRACKRHVTSHVSHHPLKEANCLESLITLNESRTYGIFLWSVCIMFLLLLDQSLCIYWFHIAFCMCALCTVCFLGFILPQHDINKQLNMVSDWVTPHMWPTLPWGSVLISQPRGSSSWVSANLLRKTTRSLLCW